MKEVIIMHIEEMESIDRAIYLSGCTEHSLNNSVIDGYIISEAKLQIFAKLIVQECMNCCIKVDDADHDWIGNSDIITGVRDGALLCRIEIKEHFNLD
jgi:hypothetical protein